MPKMPDVQKVLALKVHQWLEEWGEVEFDAKTHRSEPPHEFFMFSLNARDLKALSGIQRRTKSVENQGDLGIQRRHEEDRSREIGRFVEHGYPWSELSQAKRLSGEFNDFKKPGWLPTALVVNILGGKDRRRGSVVAPADLITISDNDQGTATLHLPAGLSDSSWKPKPLPPIEVIDGQHRLWAFEDNEIAANFELPVVAFHGLDISWQAYLFWTINIKPKKINTSLAFDLYPLLRSEDWLEKFEGHSIYRDTRAQELVERLWSCSLSPWFKRINMLGEPGTKMLSQAAWIRSLTATFVRTFEGRRVQVGGLFGAPMGEDELVLPWSRVQQATFLIAVWRETKKAIHDSEAKWALVLRGDSDAEIDAAFEGPYTLLDQDQGVRGLLHVTNDICWVHHEQLALADWQTDDLDSGQEDDDVIRDHLKSLSKQPVAKFIKEASQILAEFDWRTANAPQLSEKDRQAKLVFRGSGGYSEFRRQLLKHLADYEGDVGTAASTVLRIIG
jgi:DGQHR domain-containing protein